jgi:hypothetical protein
MIAQNEPMTSAHFKKNSGVIATSNAAVFAIGLAISLCVSAAPDASPTSAPATNPTTRPAEQAAPHDLASIKKSFAELANPDSTIRSVALTRLMSLPADALPLLHKVVEEGRPLVPAQATVLRQIVTQVFLSGEVFESNSADGFLGVHMDTVALNYGDAAPEDHPGVSSGVVVTDRMPGFPGARMLHDGDVILAILERPGVSLGSAAEFSIAVKSMGAGATIHFQVLRRGQVIQVPIKLDARPVEADPFLIDEFLKLLNRRRARADEYWSTHFAAMVKEGVS